MWSTCESPTGVCRPPYAILKFTCIVINQHCCAYFLRIPFELITIDGLPYHSYVDMTFNTTAVLRTLQTGFVWTSTLRPTNHYVGLTGTYTDWTPKPITKRLFRLIQLQYLPTFTIFLVVLDHRYV